MSNLPKEGPCYPLRYWMLSILNDTPNDDYNIDEAVQMVEMISAAYKTDGKSEEIILK